VAAAAWSDLEELEESRFQRVPRKERNGWKVFLFFCSVYCTDLCSMLYLSLLESVRVQGHSKFFWDVVV